MENVYPVFMFQQNGGGKKVKKDGNVPEGTKKMFLREPESILENQNDSKDWFHTKESFRGVQSDGSS